MRKLIIFTFAYIIHSYLCTTQFAIMMHSHFVMPQKTENLTDATTKLGDYTKKKLILTNANIIYKSASPRMHSLFQY